MKYLITFLIIMASVFSWFSLEKQSHSSLENSLWESEEVSIYKFISENLDNSGKLKESGQTLPDEEKLLSNSDSNIRFAPGAMDGAFGHHWGGGNEKELAKKIADLLESISKDGDIKKQKELYLILESGSILDFVDPTIELLFEKKIPVEPHFHNFARTLAFKSPDRNSVKFGIALLGIIRDSKDIQKVKDLGKHEEFTLYAAVAVTNSSQNPENELWEMAQSVDGWGRIHLVERLAQTENSKIKEWILRKGYRNSVMYEYLAYIAASTGEMHIALSRNETDPELLVSASEILDALIIGGPAQDISQYEEASTAILLYLKKVQDSSDLHHFAVVDRISDYLNSDRIEGWSKKELSEANQKAKTFLKKDIWIEITKDALKSDDHTVYWNAKSAAKNLDIDLWEPFRERVISNPSDSGNWFDIMTLANTNNIDEIIQLAEQKIPLEKIGTGSALENGFGPKYKEFDWHRCLYSVVQGLENHPNKGDSLVLTSLRSPIIGDRNKSLFILSKWGQDNWNDQVKAALEEALKEEVDEEVKQRIKKLIDTGEID